MAGPVRLRLLLDNNFPLPPFDLNTIDATIEATGVARFDRGLTKRNTPDWLICLRAHEGGFDAVVTRDKSQIESFEVMTTLVDTGMNVVTWRNPIEDPIQEWAQLIAYMPLIRKRIFGETAKVLLLPRPGLGKDNVLNARSQLHQLAGAERIPFKQSRDQARARMRTELDRRGLGHLAGFIQARK